jgi:ABC-type lipoprotein release transport system permease subunit
MGQEPTKSLREFEMVVLMAILQAGKSACGVTIKKQPELRTEHEISRGSIYLTLERLELFYQVSAGDYLVTLGVMGALGAVAFFATWVPARRAAHVVPVIALRHD